MYVFDFATKTWTEIQARGALPSVRSCPSWAKDDTHVYIQGGYDGVERKADFFACDLETYTWVEMPCYGSPPSPRYFHSCCLYGNKMYLYGGYSGSERLADMHVYDFETNHWSQVDCTCGDAPSGRSSLVAQVFENNLYVFGGYNGQTVLNDFYKFKLKPIGIPPPALVHDFYQLINNPDLADVRFVLEDGQHAVYAHRAILAVRSEYFRVMLCTGGMRESLATKTAAAVAAQPSDRDGGSPSHDVVMNDTDQVYHSGPLSVPIEIHDVSYNVFLKVLEFLYTDTVRDVSSLETAIHLMMASEQFMLDRLKSLCEDLIRRDIHVQNVISILVASHRHNAAGLKDIALEYILRNLNDPTVMCGLAELKAEPDLLLEIIMKRKVTPELPSNSSNATTIAAAAASANLAANTGGSAIIARDVEYIGGPFGGPGGGGNAEWRR
jgi:leucine-zipper-like transcriptional regulator 1